MRLSHRMRVEASVLLLVLAGTGSVVLTFSRTHVTAGISTSRLELYGRRFDGLRQFLPPNGVVGYTSNPDTSEARFYRTQYFVAPVLVDRSSDHELIIGNFSETVGPAWLAGQGFELVRDFGNGVMLLQRIAR